MKAFDTANVIKMEKYCQSLTVLSLLLLFLFTGCKKEAFSSVDEAEATDEASAHHTRESVLYEYRIDLVPSEPFELNAEYRDSTEGWRHLTEALLDSNDQFVLVMHLFSSDSLYYSYGESKGLNPRLHDQIADRLAFLADSLNMDDIVDSLGFVPDWWHDLEDQVKSELLPPGQIEFRALLTQINDDERYVFGSNRCTVGPIGQIVFRGFPALSVLGWRNKVSGFIPVGIGGADSVYRRSFYRNRLRTFWSFGLNGIDFCGPLFFCNNASNSWLRFGL